MGVTLFNWSFLFNHLIFEVGVYKSILFEGFWYKKYVFQNFIAILSVVLDTVFLACLDVQWLIGILSEKPGRQVEEKGGYGNTNDAEMSIKPYGLSIKIRWSVNYVTCQSSLSNL